MRQTKKIAESIVKLAAYRIFSHLFRPSISGLVFAICAMLSTILVRFKISRFLISFVLMELGRQDFLLSN